MGMLNSIGLQNPGVARVVDEILPGLDFGETRFIANVCGSTVDEYADGDRALRRLADRRHRDQHLLPEHQGRRRAVRQRPRYVRASRGRMPQEDEQAARSPSCRRTRRTSRITRAAASRPARRARRHQHDHGYGDRHRKAATPSSVTSSGGLSGPAIKPIALYKTYQVHAVAKPHGVPIIGQGGIASAHDAIEFLLAGATAVGVGTALFYDPLVCTKINAGIADYLDRHGLSSVSELTGALHV